MIGELLGNRYEILEEIGEGGMALVYKAKCLKLNRVVAVKILRPQFASDEEFVARFQREAEAVASLAHPNVVSIYDVGQDGDLYYMVMEYIRGQNLKNLIRQKGIFSNEEAINITQQICDALDGAHRHGIIHRDIKPHNILISQDGRVKVTDFGIARAMAASHATQTGVVMGSVHYFSPEQAKGGVVSTKSDLYSLGVILYELLTNRVPFDGESPIAIALKHLQEEPVAPSQINKDIPSCVERVILKLLAKDPNGRFLTAAEAKRALQNCLVETEEFEDKTLFLNRKDFSDTRVMMAAKTNKTGNENKGEIKEKKKRLSPWVYALPIILLFLGMVWAVPNYLAVPEVVVPDMTGKDFTQAEQLAKEQGLNVSVSGKSYSDQVPVDYVISQFPEADRKVKRGRNINLVISRGPELKIVPDITNRTLKEASEILAQKELLLGNQVEEYSNTIPQGYIISQVPPAGIEIKKNSKIDLVISKGPEPAWLQVPNFIGEKVEEVKKKLESLGLKLGGIKEEILPNLEPGTIIQQTPEPGTDIQQGSKVQLIVNKANRKNTEVVSIAVPPGPDKQQIRIVVKDDSGERIVYDAYHSPGDRIERAIEGEGDTKVQIYIAGNLFEEKSF